MTVPQEKRTYLQCASAWEIVQCSKRPVNPSTGNPQHPKTPKHGRRLTTTHQRDTRRSGCGNGRNAHNTGPSTSSRRISGIARRRSTSTTIPTSSRRRRRCCRRRRIGNIRSRRSTSTTITTTSSNRGRRRSTSGRGEPKPGEGRNGKAQKAQTH